MTKSKKHDEQEQRIGELTHDLQRMRADFENYRKRVESEKDLAKATGKVHAINALLPVIDTIERAVSHRPEELEGNTWADGIEKVLKQLEKQLEVLDLKKITAKPGDSFNPEFHDAIQYDEEAEGELEVISEVLQAGYTLKDIPIRHTLVKVTKK